MRKHAPVLFPVCRTALALLFAQVRSFSSSSLLILIDSELFEDSLEDASPLSCCEKIFTKFPLLLSGIFVCIKAESIPYANSNSIQIDMELVERTEKSPTMREQKSDQKSCSIQIHVLQHSWKLSFHASNICLISLNSIKQLPD